MAELQPRLDELRRVHADDPDALDQATMKLYREQKINPLRSCWWAILFGAGARTIPLLRSPLRQSLPDRVAGIVVVRSDSRP